MFLNNKNSMKRILSMIMLLVAVTTGAWAAEGDVIYSNDFSSKDQTDFANWTAASKKPSGYSYAQIGRAGTFSIATGALVNTAETGKGNASCNDASVGVFNNTIMTTTAETNYVLSFDITFNILQNKSAKSIFEISDETKQVLVCLYADHTSGSTSYGYIVGGNNGFQVVEANSTKSTNAEGNIGDGTKNELASVSEETGSKTFHVVFDAKVAGKATLTITEGVNTLVDAAEFDIAAGKGLKYMYFNNHNTTPKGGSLAQNTSSALDNFSIVEGAAATNTADYTVKYVATINDVETEIKESLVRNGFIGETVNLEAADKNSIVYNDMKYLYSSDNTSTTPVAKDGSTVIKVQFTQASSYTYTVTDNFGTELANGSAFEGDNVTYYVPIYVFNNKRFYQTPAPSTGTINGYGVGTISAIAANTDVTVTYTEEENTNVAFYSEAENLTDVTPYADQYTRGRMSNGSAAYYDASTIFTTLAPGKYTLTSCTRSGTTRFYKGEVESGTEIYSISSSGAVTTTTSNEFEIYTPTGIYTSTGNASNYFDYVIIRKTGDVTVPVTISAAGYATFSSTYALDFTSAAVEAYIATGGDANTVTMQKVEGTVAANTGLVLKGAAGNYNIPVVASGTAYNDNKLWAITSAETVKKAADGYTNYVLAKQNGKVVFASVTGENSASLPAGSAALCLQNSNSARAIDLVFGGITGINEAAQATEAAQKDGKFVINGQLVIKKNGKMFNANGAQLIY